MADSVSLFIQKSEVCAVQRVGKWLELLEVKSWLLGGWDGVGAAALGGGSGYDDLRLVTSQGNSGGSNEPRESLADN